MKQALLFLSFFLTAFCLSAQSLEVNPNPIEMNVQVDLNDFWAEPVAHSHVKNTSGQNINLRWEREIVSAPTEWEFRICDTIACYSTTTYSNVVIGGQPNVPVALANGQGSLLDLHVLPRGVAGCAEVNIKLSDAASPTTVIATASYKVCVDNLTAVSEGEKNNLRVYPNPTSNYISLTKNTAIRQLLVSNILGKRVKSFHTSFNGKYDVSDLPDGIYLVSMIDSKGTVVKTVRISKRNPRP